ncbi:hypothetical protein CN988_27690 [Bacillus thuringiensis]|uniref:helix-turn-helix domain-containing protein n=2 Tax=Bacillus thuringiensis TaxID=1428 RepID=UPI000BF3D18E|nr:helix-turn-helix domain-containing protein [Bacillus thuringiensis]PFS02460.1 hypothetical protein COK60_23140 [Bacillus thuringiensis]PFS12603.1 hypothetical protein COK45_28385 [Bacillus thuringiensis]PGN49190.1 hypothetical protein CN961_31900 [Bacillus thuringiensis]PGO78731.1 hypothetical protein CN988_27690 [Bacillus thuringiensis]
MDKFITHLIQDKSTIRKLHILQTLIDGNEIMSSKILSQNLQCTSRTIINDISQLKITLPENWELISIQSKGYLLERELSDDFSKVVAPYLLNSELYKIIVEIFNHKYYSLEKWSQLLYVDKLTLKKFLKSFQEILNQFGLSFNFRPLQLVGPELKIRHFYIMFFYNMQKYKKIFTLNPDLLQKIEYITRIYDVEIDYNLLTIITNVSINRIINKNVIPENLNFKHTFSTNKIKCIESIISELKCYFDINLSENEINLFKNTFFLISEGNIEEKINITKYYNKTQKKIYEKILALFNIISDEINLSFKIKESLKYEIYFRLYLIYACKEKNFSIGDFWSEFDTVHQEFLEGYNIMYPLISSWDKQSNENRLTDDEIYYLIYNILFILHSNYTKKCLLLLSGPASLKNFIYYKLNSELGDTLTLQLQPNCNCEYDFIITNYQIANVQIPIIQISSKTIQKDLNYIKKIISPYNKK